MPIEYAQKDLGIVWFMRDFWAPFVGPEKSVLEIGCNAGANLNALFRQGVRDLLGIEVNETAVAQLKESFPELSHHVKLWVGPVEEEIVKLPAKSVDVTFFTGAAMHIHPRSHRVFDEVVRVTREYIGTIELEDASCGYVFPRNDRRVFEKLGCQQLRSCFISLKAFPTVSRDYNGAVARLLKV